MPNTRGRTVAANGQLSIQTWISGATLLISVAAGFWYLTAQITSVSGLLQVLTANGKNAAARIESLEEDVATRRIEIAKLQSALVEIETQFCAMIEYDNMQHARDMREFAILFEKVMSQRLAVDNSFYRNCNRPPEPQ